MRSGAAGFAARRDRARAAASPTWCRSAGPKGLSQLVLLEVDYVEGDSELYVVPLSFISGDEAERVEHEAPGAVVARLRVRAEGGVLDGLLVDGIAHDTPSRLIESIQKRTTLMGEKGQLAAMTLRAFKEVAGKDPLVPRPSQFEQTNSSVLLGDKMLLKIYRQIESGPNPELELGRFFTDRGATNLPRMLAAIEYRRPNDTESATLATVQELVRNEGVAWSSAMSSIDRFFERVLQERTTLPALPPLPVGTLLQQAAQEPPAPLPELLGGFIGRARLLAKRTADMHLLLASEPADPAFSPQPFSSFYQQSLYQGAHKMWVRTVEILRKKLSSFAEPLQSTVRAIVDDETRIDARLRDITARKLELDRIRVHGDLHLGQVLDTGNDFVIIDFEGEPGRKLYERRYKRCPLRRRGRHDALVPLRLRVGAALRTPAHRGRAGAPALGAGVDRVGARRLRRRVPEGHRQRALRARRRSREGADARLLSAREMYLRDPIRAE